MYPSMNLGVRRVKLRPLIPTDFSSVSRFRILLWSSTATFPFHVGASSPSLSVGASSRLRPLSGPGGPSYNTPLAFCRSKLPLASSLYKQSRPDNQHSSLLSEVLQLFYLLLLGGSVATTIATTVPTSVATTMTSAISTTVSASLTSAMANTLTTAMTLTASVSCCGLSMLSA